MPTWVGSRLAVRRRSRDHHEAPTNRRVVTGMPGRTLRRILLATVGCSRPLSGIVSSPDLVRITVELLPKRRIRLLIQPVLDSDHRTHPGHFPPAAPEAVDQCGTRHQAVGVAGKVRRRSATSQSLVSTLERALAVEQILPDGPHLSRYDPARGAAPCPRSLVERLNVGSVPLSPIAGQASTR